MNPDLKVEKEDVTHTLRHTEVLTGRSRLALVLKVCTGEECKGGEVAKEICLQTLLEFQKIQMEKMCLSSEEILGKTGQLP